MTLASRIRKVRAAAKPPSPFEVASRPLRLEAASISTKGQRKNQEDACDIVEVGPYVLLVVADGLGGEDNGDRASAEAVACLPHLFKSKLRGMATLEQAGGLIHRAHRPGAEAFFADLFEDLDQQVYRTGGCTVLALAAVNREAATVDFAWIGDCSAMLLRRIKGERRYGRIFQSQRHGSGNVVSRCLGNHPFQARPQIDRQLIKKGDRIVVCSDGFDEAFGLDNTDAGGNLATATLTSLYENNLETPSTTLAFLESLTRDLGATDNATMVYAKVTDDTP